MNRPVAWLQRNDRRIEWGFVVLFGALLVHAIADASGVLGTPGFRPLGHVVLTTGMFLGAVAAVVAPRSRRLMIALGIASVGLVLGSLRIAG